MTTALEQDESSQGVLVMAAEVQHVAEIAAMHCAYISERSVATTGPLMKQLLHSYYGELVRRDDCALFAATAAGKVVGYASLVVNQRRAMLAAVVKQPLLLLRMVVRVRFLVSTVGYVVSKISAEFLGHKWPESCATADFQAGSELRSIAVKPEFRGRDIAVHLLEAALRHAVLRSWTPVVAWVDETNTASSKAFLKSGFRLAAQRVDQDRTANLYVWQPQEQAAAGGQGPTSLSREGEG